MFVPITLTQVFKEKCGTYTNCNDRLVTWSDRCIATPIKPDELGGHFTLVTDGTGDTFEVLQEVEDIKKLIIKGLQTINTPI